MDYIDGVLRSEDYFRDGIQSLKECAHYVVNKSGSDERIQLDGDVQRAICWLNRVPDPWGHFKYFATAVGFKEAFFELGQLDSDFRSINLTEQKWDEVTATFEHLKFLKDADAGFSSVVLDPRFKMDGVQLRCKEIYGSDADRYLEKINEDFRDVYDAYAATDSNNSKSYEMPDAMGRPSSPKSELDLYMKELKVPAVEEFDILAWWRGNAPFYPTLARMAPAAEGAMAVIDKGVLCHYLYGEDIPEIIRPLVCLRGFLSTAEN
ncbi:hypothetical protein CICLE_v10021729mg [Citrus x clementina]|uniref:Uncharacterized protein n=1 Tax=Citrus clementina TaxID=85681 RepID=V4TS64_CITCL|nr:hypothetical protein CICLE_v10021729mg [Citrus x clementina]